MRETDRQRQTDRDGDRQTDRDGDRQTDRERSTDRFDDGADGEQFASLALAVP